MRIVATCVSLLTGMLIPVSQGQESTFRLQVDLELFQQSNIRALEFDSRNIWKAIHPESIALVDLTAEEVAALEGEIRKVLDQIAQHQREHVEELEYPGPSRRQWFRVPPLPDWGAGLREELLERCVEALGEERAPWFYALVHRQAGEYMVLQGLGESYLHLDLRAGVNAPNADTPGHAGGEFRLSPCNPERRGYSEQIWTKESVPRPCEHFLRLASPKRFEISDRGHLSAVSMHEIPEDSRRSWQYLEENQGASGLAAQFDERGMRLLLPVVWLDRLQQQSFDDLDGVLKPGFCRLGGMTALEQARVQGLIDRTTSRIWATQKARAQFAVKEDTGNGRIFVPNLEAEFQPLREQFEAELEAILGSERMPLFFHPDGRPRAAQFRLMKWHFRGFGTAYLLELRGGKQDPRAKEIPKGEYWIQLHDKNPQGPMEDFIGTLNIGPLAEFPRWIRVMIPEEWRVEYAGKAGHLD